MDYANIYQNLALTDARSEDPQSGCWIRWNFVCSHWQNRFCLLRTGPHPFSMPLRKDSWTVTDQNEQPPSRRKLVLFGLLTAGLSVVMYVSFIAKVALKGP